MKLPGLQTQHPVAEEQRVELIDALVELLLEAAGPTRSSDAKEKHGEDTQAEG